MTPNYFMFRHVSGLTHWASVDCETGKVTESWGKEELIQEPGRKNARKQDCCFRQSCQRTMAIQLLNWRANLRCSSVVLVSSFLQQWNVMNFVLLKDSFSNFKFYWQTLTVSINLMKCLLFISAGPPGNPEIWWASTSEGSVEGGDELGLIGKKFQSGKATIIWKMCGILVK